MILNIGPYPPPLGGISVHLGRLKDHLDARKIPNTLWSLSRTADSSRRIFAAKQKHLMFRLFFSPRHRIVHYHVSGVAARQLAARIARKYSSKRHVITLHGDALRFIADHPIESREIFPAFDAVLSVKPGDAEKLQEMGFGSNIRYLSPFIPPADVDLELADEGVKDFIARHEHIICANGSKIIFHDEQELYGLDLCVEMMKLVHRQRQDVGLVFYLSKDNDPDYVNAIRRAAQEGGVGSHVRIHVSNEQFYPLIRRSSIFARPTNTDGEPLSIREALYFGVPVLTSDVVQRPEGCQLFENRNAQSFAEQALSILDNLENHRSRVQVVQSVTGLEELLNLYSSFGTRTSG